MTTSQRLWICALAAIWLIGSVCIGSDTAAQVPRLTPFFNATGTWSTHCEYCDKYHPGPDYPLTVYFILSDFNAWIAAVEFSVDYPPYVTWLGDGPTPPVAIGSTPTGISMAWGTPQNGFGPFVVLQANIIYHARCYHGELRVQVQPHPDTGDLAAISYGNDSLVDLEGGYAKFCSRTVPVENRSWGAIKAIYQSELQ